MYHDNVDQHAEAASKDSNLTAKEQGSDVKAFVWKISTVASTVSREVAINNVKDAIYFPNYVEARDANGKEIEMSSLSPTYSVSTASESSAVSVSSDGYIVALANTTGAGAAITATLPASTAGSNETNEKTLIVKIGAQG